MMQDKLQEMQPDLGIGSNSFRQLPVLGGLERHPLRDDFKYALLISVYK